VTKPKGWTKDQIEPRSYDSPIDQLPSPPPPSKGPPSSAASASPPPPRRHSSGSDIKAGIWIVCFIGGFALIIVASITVNLYAGIFGLIMFGIGVGALSWAQGVQEAKYAGGRGGGHGSNNQWNGYYTTRRGSANAKRNMRRGYRYSKKK
jgi:hypothetical protein